jgi:hypothetical protein
VDFTLFAELFHVQLLNECYDPILRLTMISRKKQILTNVMATKLYIIIIHKCFLNKNENYT